MQTGAKLYVTSAGGPFVKFTAKPGSCRAERTVLSDTQRRFFSFCSQNFVVTTCRPRSLITRFTTSFFFFGVSSVLGSSRKQMGAEKQKGGEEKKEEGR